MGCVGILPMIKNKNTMNCNCFNDVQEKLRVRLEDPQAEMNGMLAYNAKTKQYEFYPTIAIHYRKKLKDGSLAKGRTEIQIAYNYCPFCGNNVRDMRLNHRR